MEAALDLVVRKLAQQIEKETSLVSNFKQDFEWLKMRLSMLKATLQFVDETLQFGDENGTQNMSVQQWIEDVRDIMWDAEDILDEYPLHEEDDVVGDNLCYCSYPQPIIFRYKMGRKIRKIKERMKSIMETANELMLIRNMASSEIGPSESTVQPGGKWKKSCMMEYGSLPVAIDLKVQDIIEQLDDPAIQVVVVVGMGGIGKTFLLQHVYNNIKHRFDDSVWLSVSQTYSIEQLQRDLAFKLNLMYLASSKISYTVAAEDIHDRLKERKCLIVLDDVWRATEEVDFIRSLGIPLAINNKCKVIISSRNKEVFSHLQPFIYEMALLSVDDSWKLFCAHAFSENSPPAHLEMFAREIEKECGKLPLAIKTVASSLAKATTSKEWKLKLQQLKEVRVNSHDPIMQILKLSYYWLPSFLKPCFAYLSFFPEDENIDCEYLIHLWIAEGFIPQTEDQVDVAWDYLSQLKNLCLVDVWESYYPGGCT